MQPNAGMTAGIKAAKREGRSQSGVKGLTLLQTGCRNAFPLSRLPCRCRCPPPGFTPSAMSPGANDLRTLSFSSVLFFSCCIRVGEIVYLELSLHAHVFCWSLCVFFSRSAPAAFQYDTDTAAAGGIPATMPSPPAPTPRFSLLARTDAGGSATIDPKWVVALADQLLQDPRPCLADKYGVRVSRYGWKMREGGVKLQI